MSLLSKILFTVTENSLNITNIWTFLKVKCYRSSTQCRRKLNQKTLTRVTRQLQSVEEEQLILPEHLIECTPGFKWSSCCSIFNFLCNVLSIVVCPFVFFLLVIVWSVLLRLRLLITPLVFSNLSSHDCLDSSNKVLIPVRVGHLICKIKADTRRPSVLFIQINEVKLKIQIRNHLFRISDWQKR